MKQKILITGANGLLGRRLIETIPSENEIYGVELREKDLLQKENLRWIIQDISQPLDFKKFPLGVDTIIHLAQSPNFRDFPNQALDIFLVNDYSTMQFLEYGRQCGIKSFIYAASGGVCGYKDKPITETDQPALLNFYQTTKYISELLVNNYTNYFNIIVLRYFFIYGERQPKHMFIPRLIDNIKTGRPIILTKPEGIKINPIYVGDAALATARALELNNRKIINVGGAEVVGIRQLAETIGKILGKHPQYELKEDPDAGNLIADIDQAKLHLNFNPSVSLEEGLRRLIKAQI